jgi:sugar phosphate permease
MPKMEHHKPARPFWGWYVVAGGFVNSMLLIGATTYSFSLFIKPLEQDFGLTRVQSNLGLVMLLVSFALSSPVVGRLLHRHSVRVVSTVGACLFAAGMAAIALASQPWMMAVAILMLIGPGVTAAGAFAANTVVARWFTNKRGRAMGVVAVATSAGGFVVIPTFAFALEMLGWRLAVLSVGSAIALLVGITTLLLMRDRPSDLGQEPDGSRAAPVTTPSEEQPMTGRMIARSRNFWLIGIGTGILLGSDQAVLASLIPWGLEQGFTLAQASLLMSVLTGSAIVGKLVVGWLADRLDKRLLFAVVCVFNIVFLSLLLTGPSYPVLMIASAMIGMAIGGVYPVWTTITAENFGKSSFGVVYGAMNLVTTPCALVSITLAGHIFDKTGGYDLAFTIFIALDVVAALCIAMVRRSDRGAALHQPQSDVDAGKDLADRARTSA